MGAYGNPYMLEDEIPDLKAWIVIGYWSDVMPVSRKAQTSLRYTRQIAHRTLTQFATRPGI